jgi:hypothetical protein
METKEKQNTIPSLEQIGITLDPWQQEVLKTEGNIVLRSGRQSGKSTVTSILAGDYAATNKGKLVMVIAAVERQAYLLFEKILYYMEKTYPRLIKQGKDRPTKSCIKLTNGSIIHCLPTGLTGYGIRGYTIDLLIADEAAFIPEEVFTAITPALATRYSKGARIVLLSTPFGRQGYFYSAFNDETFTKFHVSSEECPRIDKEFLQQEKRRMTELQYTQEYLGEFIDELRQFFPDELIKKCMRLQRPNTIDNTKNYYLGVDIARMGEDESTFEIGYLDENKHVIQVENQITTKTRLNETTNHIISLNHQYIFKKIFIDDEGIGVAVYDYLLQEDSTKRAVVPINNSQRILDKDETKRTRLLKEDLYSNLLRLMEAGEIQLLEDPEIFQSLKSVQFQYTSDTLGRSHLKIFGNYTHIAEGLIRLGWCVKYKSLNTWIDSF